MTSKHDIPNPIEPEQIRELWDHVLSLMQRVHTLNAQMSVVLQTLQALIEATPTIKTGYFESNN